MVSDKQYWRRMKLLNTGKTLGKAAAQADMDEKTARQCRHLGKSPSQAKQSRQYRTRADVFNDTPINIRSELKHFEIYVR